MRVVEVPPRHRHQARHTPAGVPVLRRGHLAERKGRNVRWRWIIVCKVGNIIGKRREQDKLEERKVYTATGTVRTKGMKRKN